MAIAINGSGTITGITSGGLPDNIITNAEMADDSVGIADLSATGTASSSTYLRGDNSWSTPSGGLIKQLKVVNKSDVWSTTSTSWTDITDFSITTDALSSASNKILVSYNIGLTGGNNDQFYLRILRGSTPIAIGDEAGNRVRLTTWAIDSSGSNPDFMSAEWLDTPGSGAHTYKVQHRHYNSGVTVTMNKMSNEYYGDHADYTMRWVSSFRIMEIEA
tara:strand:+ start:1533 stop:2186 length:654 start_codon:yes stop_codon:yes gene_type:complete